MQPIAVLYEHPEWFKPLSAELERRAAPHLAFSAGDHRGRFKVLKPSERPVER